MKKIILKKKNKNIQYILAQHKHKQIELIGFTNNIIILIDFNKLTDFCKKGYKISDTVFSLINKHLC